MNWNALSNCDSEGDSVTTETRQSDNNVIKMSINKISQIPVDNFI